MTDKLRLYNGGLGHLETRRLKSLTERREPRRVFDDIFDSVVEYCLGRKLWNFINRTVQIDASTTLVPAFGYQFAFKIPDDWIRTVTASAQADMKQPLVGADLEEEAGYWYANCNPLWVKYNSRDPLYGLNLGEWPEQFCDYVEIRLAVKGCVRITGNDNLLKGAEGLLEREKKSYKIAEGVCGMNDPVGETPTGTWVRARRGAQSRGSSGGDTPGGSLMS